MKHKLYCATCRKYKGEFKIPMGKSAPKVYCRGCVPAGTQLHPAILRPTLPPTRN